MRRVLLQHGKLFLVIIYDRSWFFVHRFSTSLFVCPRRIGHADMPTSQLVEGMEGCKHSDTEGKRINLSFLFAKTTQHHQPLGGLEHDYVFPIGKKSSSQLTHIFQGGRLNHTKTPESSANVGICFGGSCHGVRPGNGMRTRCAKLPGAEIHLFSLLTYLYTEYYTIISYIIHYNITMK